MLKKQFFNIACISSFVQVMIMLLLFVSDITVGFDASNNYDIAEDDPPQQVCAGIEAGDIGEETANIGYTLQNGGSKNSYFSIC